MNCFDLFNAHFIHPISGKLMEADPGKVANFIIAQNTKETHMQLV